MRKSIFIFALCLVASVLPLAPAQAAGTRLPFDGFGDMVVDATGSRVLVSSGRAGSAISVMSFDGAVQRTVTGHPGVGGMVIDDSNLYALMGNAGEIRRFTLSTLSQTDSWTVPMPTTGSHLVRAGGRLWYGSGECSQWEGRLTSLDPSTGTVETFTDDRAFYCPGIAAAPGDPDLLYVWELGLSPTTVYRYDVSGAAPVQLGSHRLDASNTRDIAVAPDGTVFVASGSPYEIERFSADMTSTGIYPTGPYPTAVAISADGTKLAGGLYAPYDPDVFVFPIGDSTPTATFELGDGSSNDLYPGALAFSPDTTKVFAVAGDDGTSAFFRVLSNAPARRTAVTIDVSKTKVNYNGSVTITGRMTSPVPVGGERVAIVGSTNGGPVTTFKTTTVASNGTYRTSVQVPRKTTFRVRYEGGDGLAPSQSTTKTVLVKAILKAALLDPAGTDGRYKIYRMGSRPTLLTALKPAHDGSSVSYVAQVYTGVGWTTFDRESVPMGPGGLTSVYLVVSGSYADRKYRIKPSWAGDADHLGDSAGWSYLTFRGGSTSRAAPTFRLEH